MIKMKKNEDLNTRPSQKEMAELENLHKLNQFDSLEEKTREVIENHPRVSILSWKGKKLHQKNADRGL